MAQQIEPKYRQPRGIAGQPKRRCRRNLPAAERGAGGRFAMAQRQHRHPRSHRRQRQPPRRRQVKRRRPAMGRQDNCRHPGARHCIGAGTQKLQCVGRLDQQQPRRIDAEFNEPQSVKPAALASRTVLPHPDNGSRPAIAQRQQQPERRHRRGIGGRPSIEFVKACRRQPAAQPGIDRRGAKADPHFRRSHGERRRRRQQGRKGRKAGTTHMFCLCSIWRYIAVRVKCAARHRPGPSPCMQCRSGVDRLTRA